MLKDFNAVKISVASPQDVMNWSHGEVTKAETINYRTFRSEPNGLMAEEIFGPTKDFECYCGKYKKIRYKGIVCDRCGVEVTHKRVRRERMGHIKLAAPVAHVWFSNGIPNRLALILDIPQKKLETVIYYARYVVTGLNEEEQKAALESLKELKTNEIKDLSTELEDKIQEIEDEYKQLAEDAKKENKDKNKQKLQLERNENSRKKEIARLKAAYKQKQDNIDKKFSNLKSLINEIKVGYTLSEEEHSMLEEYDFFFYDAGMGAEAIKELLDVLDIATEVADLEEVMKTTRSQLKKSKVIQRIRILKGLQRSGVNPSWLIMDVLPVIPPDLRPIIQLPGGRFATYDLNDLYRRVINRNNRLRRLINLGAPEIILRNEKRMLQESVDSLLDNNHKPGAPALNTRGMPFKSLSDMLRGKQGRFRQNLLGKRVDYSGRAVIVAGPDLRFDQCGLPKNVALELFKPFVIRELIERGYAANPTRAKMIFESKDPEVWDILEDVIKDRPVLLNRAPSLHRYSILAFYPQLIEGNAIRLHPMVVQGFNADFDGDQMAVHLPLSDEAVQEVKERMFAKDNILALRDATPIVNVSKDMAMGIYFLTLMKGDEKDAKHAFSSGDELITAYKLGIVKFYEPVKLLLNDEIIVTTAGRVIFNNILPEEHEFLNESYGKKGIAKLSSELFRKYGQDIAINVLDSVKDLGFDYATELGFSISMGEFRYGAKELADEKLEEYMKKEKELLDEYYEGMITQKELKRLKLAEWSKSTDEIQEGVWSLAQSKPEAVNLIDLDDSGAVPVSSWVKQISGVRGSVSNMDGDVVSLPLKNNFEKGLNNFEYFVASKAVRKSFSDVALKTAESGYLTRRLVDVSQDIITKIDDCETDEGIWISRNDSTKQMSFENRIKGRYAAEDIKDKKGNVIVKKGEDVTIEAASAIDADDSIEKVYLRSPLKCKVAHGLCAKCYGYDNGTGEKVEIGEAVGIIAAQALGEPTTQLTLKSKSDARAKKSDVTQGLPRVEELLEARTPKALAQLADVDGKISIIEDKKKIIIRITSKQELEESFDIDTKDEVVVKDKSSVKSGETLIVRSDKSEIRAPFTGKVKVAKDSVKITSKKDIEIEKSADSMANVLVHDGQEVNKGDQLTFGSVDPKELAALKPIEVAQRYIIDGVQSVYGIQGLEVDDRHLEIIARQMSRYVLINDSGESETHLPGDYADVLTIEAENAELKEAGKDIIKYERVLLGVTNSAIRTESFLSAASFEQQVRVLTDAALIGKVDHLRGLKENVIIGRPVPLGKVLQEQDSNEIEETQEEVNAIKSNEETVKANLNKAL
ncbi:DNA-directed RNA polymerase subunit beta' [Candidatus Dojkabacteria bacterium]|uniref:DNA-directed RNA polymerase subunit beta' n=1 Tax=Candidatus Dojkabacteria bacterium TaxID=2099670 RepID=A0A955ICM9_9BACT|nr:DNA-directed RNA polymerase subunit beta' [Candidatus Dojkabacteria bacterium]